MKNNMNEMLLNARIEMDKPFFNLRYKLHRIGNFFVYHLDNYLKQKIEGKK